jgi:hypothetical protein
LKVELGQATARFTAFGTYEIDEKSSSHLTRLAGQEGGGGGSGTAFVVHRDGLLVTCAHVVRGASKVNVSLGGKTYSGDVVGIDDGHDLALVRIAANNLPALPLAAADTARLAEEVRAIGFPLSDVLGTSVKVTRGSVSGLVVQKGEKLLQIDASINPGNSGGPLVNDRGEVLGVNSAGLVGEAVTNVGFAVPIEYVWSFLQSKGVAPTGVSGGRQLDGPALAAAATPAVALVTVNLGEGQPVQLLQFRGSCDSHLDSGSLYSNPYRSPFGDNRHAEGKLLMLPSGDVMECTAEQEMPLMMMPVAEMAIEKLPEGGEREWENRRVTAFTIGESTSSDGLLTPGRFGRPRGYPRFPGTEPPRAVALIPATAHVKYKIKGETAETIEIAKTIDLMTIEREGQTPRFQIVGDGTLVWDKKLSVPKSLSQSMTMAISADGNRMTAPMEYEVKLYAAQTLDEMREMLEKNKTEAEKKAAEPKKAAEQSAQASSSPTSAARPTSQPPAKRSDPVNELDRILLTLKGQDRTYGTLYSPLRRLAAMEPVPSRREEVAQLLESILSSSDQNVRRAALDAICRWGTQTNVPTLLLLAGSSNHSDYRKAIEALGEIGGSVDAAKTLAGMLPDPTLGLYARRALQKMGPIAEDPVWEHATDKNKLVALYACSVLEQIGTEKSLERLRSLPTNAAGSRGHIVEKAISAIEARVAMK